MSVDDCKYRDYIPISAPLSYSSVRSSSDSDASSRSGSDAPGKEAPWRKLKEFVTEHQVDPSSYTTVMIRNIPGKYTIECLLAEIRHTGNEVNFVHLPLAKKCDINLGYAFVNFVTSSMARDFLRLFDGHHFLKQPNSAKRAAVDFASMQGYDANVEFYSKRRIAGTKRAPWILPQ
jgi:hypothetical protein